MKRQPQSRRDTETATEKSNQRFCLLCGCLCASVSQRLPFFFGPKRGPNWPNVAQKVTACHHYTNLVERTHRARRRGLLTVRTATG